MKRMEDFLQGKRRALIAGSALLVLLIMVDVSTNSELNLSPLYLAPVLLVTWYVGTAWGVSFAVVAILVSVVIGIWTGPARVKVVVASFMLPTVEYRAQPNTPL